MGFRRHPLRDLAFDCRRPLRAVLPAALLLLLQCWSSQGQYVDVRGGARFIFTAAGARSALVDPNASLIVLADDILLNDTVWKPANLSRPLSIIGAGPTLRTIDFGGVISAISVQSAGNLTFQNVTLKNAFSQQRLRVTDLPFSQLDRVPQLVLWPSLVMKDNSTVVFRNTTTEYYEPLATISCQNYTAKLVFGLQTMPNRPNFTVLEDGVSIFLNGTSRFESPVQNPVDNSTIGSALLLSTNTTNICLENTAVPKSGSGGLPGWAAAVIAVVAVLAVLAVGGVVGFILFRRWRRKKAPSSGGLSEKVVRTNTPTGTTASQLASGSPGGSISLSHAGYLRPESSTGQISALLGDHADAIRPIGSSHSQASSQGEVRSLGSFGPPSGGAVGGVGSARPPSNSTIDSNTLASLLRNRSSGGLAGVEVGPLLGRGSYGRVYKGRWKGVPVAIKVVDHMSSAGNCVDAARESVLSSSVQHPNVVITYKIVTINLTEVPNLPATQPTTPAAPDADVPHPLLGSAAQPRGGPQAPAPSLEKNDSAKVSQGKTPGTSPPSTYDEEAARPMSPSPRSPFNGAEPQGGAGGPGGGGGARGEPLPKTQSQAPLEHTHSGQSDRQAASGTQGVSMEALLATRPTPVGVSFQKSDPQDWEDDEDPDQDPEEAKAPRSRPNIVETWMLLEYCDRGNLDGAMRNHRFKRKADSTPDLVCIYRCLIDIAAGMDYLHSVGVLHGDLKAANVLCKSTATDPRGFTCKLADFGLSRLLDPTMTHVSTKSYGTISYMPAEVLKDGRLTPAADVYSFAMMMWEMYCSQALFEGQTMAQVFYMVCYEGHRPAIPADCPAEYRELMEECWANDAEARPPFSDISPRLQNIYAGLRTRMRPPNAEAAHPPRTPGPPPFTSPFAAVPPRPSPTNSARDSPAAGVVQHNGILEQARQPPDAQQPSTQPASGPSAAPIAPKGPVEP